MENFTILRLLLNEHKNRYHIIAEHSSDIISIVDQESLAYTYISPSFEKLLGYFADDIVENPAWKLSILMIEIMYWKS